jgi:hypothetical protein
MQGGLHQEIRNYKPYIFFLNDIEDFNAETKSY